MFVLCVNPTLNGSLFMKIPQNTEMSGSGGGVENQNNRFLSVVWKNATTACSIPWVGIVVERYDGIVCQTERERT